MKAITIFLIIFFHSSIAYAYIDPGLIAGFFNIIVAGVSAFFFLFVFRPFNFIKNLFSKKNKDKEKEKENYQDEDDNNKK
tara:strand:- start:285 stop:524 length:240 start_codon:yes stop_codon:yes gene_type:complete